MQSVFSHIKQHLRWYILLLLIIFNFTLIGIILHEDRRGILKFEVLDIGQGDALWIESPTGTQVLVDGGPNKSLMKEIPNVIPWYDRHIDMLVVTNPDRDHFEGFIALLKKYSVDVVLEPGTKNNTDTYNTFEKEVADRKIPKILAHSGQVIDLGGGAYIQVLFPDRDVSGLSSNDGSIVMKLVYGDTSVMLTGDSTEKIENYLINVDKGILKSTILKAGHHGSRTSSSENYVKAINPLITVASSGINNDYGHPHKETVKTMNDLGIPFYDTCNNGRLILESDGEKFVLKNENIKEAMVGCHTN